MTEATSSAHSNNPTDNYAIVLDPENPLAKPSTLKFGLPDFAAIKTKHLEPAVLAGIAAEEAEWEVIATNPEAPTVENTYEALQRSGALLNRATTAMFTLCASIGGDELNEIEERVTEPLAEHANKLMFDQRIYDRLAAIDLSETSPETTYAVTELLKEYRRGGIDKDQKTQDRLREIDMELSSLETRFEQLATRAMDNGPVLTRAELSGIDPDTDPRCSAVESGFKVALDNTSQPDLLTSLTNPQGRRKLLNASLNRATGAVDTRGIIRRIVELRAESAELLGYPDYASLVAESNVVGQASRIKKLLSEVGVAAATKATAELKELEKFAGSDAGSEGITSSDWTFWATRLHDQLTGIDEEDLRNYLELGNVYRNGVFFAANRLYGISFTPAPQFSGWHEDVQTWLVHDHDGRELALFLLDPYARKGKSGGAWMHEIVAQSRLLGNTPVIANNLNLIKPESGVTLLPWSEVITAFHEFGHALHGILSDCYYPDQAGTSCPPDWVEVPSQLNEMWAYNRIVIQNFARHHKTGEALPEATIDRLISMRTQGQGFTTAEFTAAASLDQYWHRQAFTGTNFAAIDVDAFESEALAACNLHESMIPPRYRTTFFTHSFGGGYDAGYYSYMWAELYVAELEEWLINVASRNNDGGLNRAAGQKLRNELLARGTTRDPEDSFRAILGRDPKVQPLLRRHGLI